jgi:uncharacterized protein YdaU (DUF1376 family)
MNYYSHHIGDYLIDTAHLSILEDGVYRRLMDRYYTTEAPLTDDEAALFRVIRARSEDEKEAVRSVLSEFFKLTEAGWTHKRCDLEIAAYQVKQEANRTNGVKGGRPKKQSAEPKAIPEITQWVSENNPDITLTNNQEPKRKPPHTPQGGQDAEQCDPPAEQIIVAGKPPKTAAAIAFKTFLETCKATGEKPVPEGDPVFEYANEAGIPHDFLRLQWCEFRVRYSQPGSKRYKDWRSVFRKSVRGNWLRLWYCNETGYALTTQGQQAKKIHEGRQ